MRVVCPVCGEVHEAMTMHGIPIIPCPKMAEREILVVPSSLAPDSRSPPWPWGEMTDDQVREWFKSKGWKVDW